MDQGDIEHSGVTSEQEEGQLTPEQLKERIRQGYGLRATDNLIIYVGDSDAAEEQRELEDYLKDLKTETELEFSGEFENIEFEIELKQEEGTLRPSQLREFRRLQKEIKRDYKAWHAEFSEYEKQLLASWNEPRGEHLERFSSQDPEPKQAQPPKLLAADIQVAAPRG